MCCAVPCCAAGLYACSAAAAGQCAWGAAGRAQLHSTGRLLQREPHALTHPLTFPLQSQTCLLSSQHCMHPPGLCDAVSCDAHQTLCAQHTHLLLVLLRGTCGHTWGGSWWGGLASRPRATCHQPSAVCWACCGCRAQPWASLQPARAQWQASRDLKGREGGKEGSKGLGTFSGCDRGFGHSSAAPRPCCMWRQKSLRRCECFTRSCGRTALQKSKAVCQPGAAMPCHTLGLHTVQVGDVLASHLRFFATPWPSYMPCAVCLRAACLQAACCCGRGLGSPGLTAGVWGPQGDPYQGRWGAWRAQHSGGCGLQCGRAHGC